MFVILGGSFVWYLHLCGFKIYQKVEWMRQTSHPQRLYVEESRKQIGCFPTLIS